MPDTLRTERCVNAHDRCYEGGPCPYCEPSEATGPAASISVLTYGGVAAKAYMVAAQAEADLTAANELYWDLMSLYTDPRTYARVVDTHPLMAELREMFQIPIRHPIREDASDPSPFAVVLIEYAA